jgi:hypothetical protein
MSQELMAKLGKDGTSLEITWETPLIGAKGRMLKKIVKRKSTINLNDVMVIDQHFDSKGKLLPDQCRIYYSGLGWLVANETYEEMSNYKLGHQTTIKGFNK